MANDYWKERLQAEQAAKMERGAALSDEMDRLYQHHFNELEKEIRAFEQRYADKNHISLSEVKAKVSEMDVKAFEEKAKRYVEEKDFSPEANAELSLYNLKMKINRLELLQYQLDLEMVALTNGEHKLTKKFLNDEYVQSLQTQAGLLGKSVLSANQIEKVAQTVINTPFKGAKWSERVWQRQDALREIVASMTQDYLLKGKNPTTMISKIRKEFGVSASEAKRLAVTEGARVATEAEKQSYIANGYDEYEYIAEPSACKFCKPLDGKIFKVKDMEPGKNAAPKHPNCHCSTAAHFSMSDDEYERLIRESAESVGIQYVGPNGINGSSELQFGEERYLGQRQSVNISPKKFSNSFSVNRNLVNSKLFHDKFERLPFSKNVNENLYKSSLKILEHRDGSNLEDLYILNARTGKEVTKNVSAKQGYRVGLSNAQYVKVLAEESIVILHNHPEGGRLSYTDIKTLFETPNARGSVVVGHDGSVFIAHSPNRNVSIADIYQKVYNEFVGTLQNKELAAIKATDALYKMGVFSYEEI